VHEDVLESNPLQCGCQQPNLFADGSGFGTDPLIGSQLFRDSAISVVSYNWITSAAGFRRFAFRTCTSTLAHRRQHKACWQRKPKAYRAVPSRRLVGLVLRLAGTQRTKLAARAGWLPMLPADPGRFVSTEAQEMTVSFSSRSPAAAERANRAQSGLKGRVRLL